MSVEENVIYTLREVYELTQDGAWSKPGWFGDCGVKGYSDPSYLAKLLGVSVEDESVKTAQALCLKAINQAIIDDGDKDPYIAIEFVRLYPEVLKSPMQINFAYVVLDELYAEDLIGHKVIRRILDAQGDQDLLFSDKYDVKEGRKLPKTQSLQEQASAREQHHEWALGAKLLVGGLSIVAIAAALKYTQDGGDVTLQEIPGAVNITDRIADFVTSHGGYDILRQNIYKLFKMLPIDERGLKNAATLYEVDHLFPPCVDINFGKPSYSSEPCGATSAFAHYLYALKAGYARNMADNISLGLHGAIGFVMNPCEASTEFLNSVMEVLGE